MNAYFATAPRGVEDLLARELTDLGVREVRLTANGVRFSGSEEVAYRAVLWSRLANRILLPLAEFKAQDPETLYREAKKISWQRHLDAKGSLWVDVYLTNAALQHGRYAAQVLKDAVVDHFRAREGQRPRVDRDHPDLRLNLAVKRDEAVVSVDLGGGSLHRRGYRTAGGTAPLKENLAAAILIRAGWPGVARAGGGFVDPLCGSGTLLIEAALMAANRPPRTWNASDRPTHWKGFDSELWRRLLREAEGSSQKPGNGSPAILGFDTDRKVLEAAAANIRQAGVHDLIALEQRPLEAWNHGPELSSGLVAANPPYGDRLGSLPQLVLLYARLGHLLRAYFRGWRAAILTGNPLLGKTMGIRAQKRNKFFNGAIPCELLLFTLEKPWILEPEEPALQPLPAGGTVLLSEGGLMLRNRLTKTLKRMGKWLKTEGVEVYRLYDGDLPEYNINIDVYGAYALIREYPPPKQLPREKALRRLHEAVLVTSLVLELDPERMLLEQIGEKADRPTLPHGGKLVLGEQGLTFEVHILDSLGTGLTPLERGCRTLLRGMARGKRFLCLNSRSGTATVYAAAGGALSTLTVTPSADHLDWSRENMKRNGFQGKGYRFIKDDGLEWARRTRERFDLIYLDMPLFANPGRAASRDVPLLRAAAALLKPGGVLVCFAEHKRFPDDKDAWRKRGYQVVDASRQALTKDAVGKSKLTVWTILKQKVDDRGHHLNT